jgi:hypothetical protein
MKTIGSDLLYQPVEGYHLNPGSLANQLGEQPVLLVFLRHFGCIFCKETVADIRAAAAADPQYPDVLFVAQGTPQDAQGFFASAWPEARCITDSGRVLYAGFGVPRGSTWQSMNPSVMACGVRAFGKGHMQGKTQGDPWQMPGLFYVHGNQILWQRDYAHQGDSPDWTQLPQSLPLSRGDLPVASPRAAVHAAA